MPLVKKFVPPPPPAEQKEEPQAANTLPAGKVQDVAATPAKPTEAVRASEKQPPRTLREKIAEVEARITRQRRIMNLLKSVMPVVSAIIIRPGSAATPQEKAAAIDRMAVLASDATHRLMEACAPDLADRGWAQAEMFGVCANIVADEWRAGGDLDAAQVLLDPAFIEAFTSRAADMDARSLAWLSTPSSPPPVKDASDAASRVRLSLLKASVPLLLDIKRFSFWKQHLHADEPNRLASRLVERLAAIAAENTRRQVEAYGMEFEHRVSLYQGTIARTFQIARDEYRMLANRAVGEVNAVADRRQKSAIRYAWATEQKGDIVQMVAATADEMIRLLDGIVGKMVQDYRPDEVLAQKQGDSHQRLGMRRG